MSEAQLHRMFSRARLNDRQINELVGLALGIIADGKVNHAEAEFLQKWLAANQGVCANPVIGALFERITQMLQDDYVDPDEAEELFDTLKSFSGGDFELGEMMKSSSLPLCEPPPEVGFVDKVFVFTGTFAFGSRRQCENAVKVRGGSVGDVTRRTNYLVVGIYATEAWIHSSYGRKIEKAVDMRSRGIPISIISEKHWIEKL